MSRNFRDIINSCLRVETNFINECEESRLIQELMKKLKLLKWSEGHFDEKIRHYKEFTITHNQQFPYLNDIFNQKIRHFLPKKEFLPWHVIELGNDGEVKPHIDNKYYSGSLIAGISLQRDSILTLSDPFEPTTSFQITLPRRSIYQQM